MTCVTLRKFGGSVVMTVPKKILNLYVATRFPTMNVTFVHSGWGGDRVGGGGGGPIDVRLWRDVLPFNPTAVTIMLGMNDGGYCAFDATLFEDYPWLGKQPTC